MILPLLKHHPFLSPPGLYPSFSSSFSRAAYSVCLYVFKANSQKFRYFWTLDPDAYQFNIGAQKKIFSFFRAKRRILSVFYSDFIRILSGFYPYFIRGLPEFFIMNFILSYFICLARKVGDWALFNDGMAETQWRCSFVISKRCKRSRPRSPPPSLFPPRCGPT